MLLAGTCLFFEWSIHPWQHKMHRMMCLLVALLACSASQASAGRSLSMFGLLLNFDKSNQAASTGVCLPHTAYMVQRT